MAETTIAGEINRLGGADARYGQRDHGTIEAMVFDADDMDVGVIQLTRRQINSEIRQGLLSRSVAHDNARDPRYQWAIEIITPTGERPQRRYHYLNHYDATLSTLSAAERQALRQAAELGLRLTWGIGGGKNRLHEDDWPVLADRLAQDAR